MEDRVLLVRALKVGLGNRGVEVVDVVQPMFPVNNCRCFGSFGYELPRSAASV